MEILYKSTLYHNMSSSELFPKDDFNQPTEYNTCSAVIRVETSTVFATRVPDIHYPTGTRVLVTVNLVSD